MEKKKTEFSTVILKAPGYEYGQVPVNARIDLSSLEKVPVCTAHRTGACRKCYPHLHKKGGKTK